MTYLVQEERRNKSGSRSTAIASIAALSSAIVASSCCLPVVPFLFAAGAASASAIVAQLRPYLLVVSILCIVFAFYKSWRAKQCDGKRSRTSIFLLWFSAIVVFVFVFFPQVIADLLAGRP